MNAEDNPDVPDDRRIEAVLAGLLALVSGDHSPSIELGGSDDAITAMAVAVHLLGEVLEMQQLARTRAEEALADAVDAFELAPVALASLDDAWRVRRANGSFRELFGSHTLGRPLQAVLGEDGGRVQAALERAGHEPLEVSGVLLGGEPRRVVDVQVVRTAGGRSQIALHDVTERRALHERLAHVEKLDSVGRVAGEVAHDFKNQLTVMWGLVHLLREEHGTSGDLDELEQAVERSNELAGRLLSLSRREKARPQVVALGQLVEATARALHAALPEGVRLEVRCASDPPVFADPAGVEQVVANLVRNAAEAMGPGRIEVMLTERDGFARLEVRDQGPGMRPEVLQRVFEPYFTTKPEGKGTGIGLATVFRVVHDAGGDVTADSTPGQGATFVVRWPLLSGEVSPVAAPVVPITAARSRILVIDDDPEVLGFTVRILRSGGYDAVGAVDGPSALPLLGDDLALVVSDGGLVRQSPALARRLAELPSRVPVLRTSAQLPDRPDDVAASIFLLARPFTPFELLERVATLLSVSAAR
jgi:signal transduction histidine kinase